MTRDYAKALLPIIEQYAAGKTVQVFIGGTWVDLDSTDFSSHPSHYRIKPEPREWWLNEYNGYAGKFVSIWNTKESADLNANTTRLRCIRVREVLE
jgi:hypothetical protein